MKRKMGCINALREGGRGQWDCYFQVQTFLFLLIRVRTCTCNPVDFFLSFILQKTNQAGKGGVASKVRGRADSGMEQWLCLPGRLVVEYPGKVG